MSPESPAGPPPAEPGSAATRNAEASRLARGGVLQILAALGQALLPLYQVLVARLFGAYAQGVYGYALGMIDVLGRLGLVGADKGLLRFVAAHRAEADDDKVAQALASALRLCVPVAVVLVLVLVLGAERIARMTGFAGASFVFRAMAPAVLWHVLMMTLVAATLGARTSRVHLLVRGGMQPLLLIVGALLAWASGAGLYGVAVAHVVVFAVLVVVAFLGVYRVFGRAVVVAALKGPGLPGFARFALPMGISEFTNAILQRADILILGAFVDAKMIAFYYGAEQLTRSVGGIRYAFDGIAAPLLAEAHYRKQNDRLQHSLALLTRWVALASAPIAMVVFTLRVELLSLFGPEYVAATTALVFILLGQSVNSIIGLTPHALIMAGRSDLFMWTNLGAALFNVGINLILIPRHGIVGAAISACCAVTALQVALAIETWIAVRVHPLSKGLVKAVAAAVVAGVVAAWVRGLLAPRWEAAVAAVGAGVVSYAVIVIALGLDPEDSSLLTGKLRKLRKRR